MTKNYNAVEVSLCVRILFQFRNMKVSQRIGLYRLVSRLQLREVRKCCRPQPVLFASIMSTFVDSVSWTLGLAIRLREGQFPREIFMQSLT